MSATTAMRTYDCVIPVRNEEQQLEASVRTLHRFLSDQLPACDWCIVIADNASTDHTPEIGRRLADSMPRIAYCSLSQAGRGRALKSAWMQSNADFVSYMDVDLSTNLKALPEMLRLLEQDVDVVLGSRLIAGAYITRSRKREIISRGWNFLVGLVFNTRFSDSQCGFKGLRREAKERLVPYVRDARWFFDTELLVLAEKQGFAMREVAVEWVEDLGSTVDIPRTVCDDLVAMVRLKRQLVRSAGHALPAPVTSGPGFSRRPSGGPS